MLTALNGIPGARAISDRLPLAPTKDFASAILGTVGPATAELVKDSDGRIKAGDDVGLSGLQKRYDEQLFGTRGATVVAVDDKGERRTLFTADPEPGQAPAYDDRRRGPAGRTAGPRGRRTGECPRGDPALDR